MKIPTLDFLTDRVAMFAAVLVGMGTVGFMFVSIAPDLWSKLVLGLLGVVIVLFSVRALAKKKRGLWWLTAFLIVFSDVSLLLTLTAVQSQEATTETVKVDPVQTHLQTATKTAEDNLTKLIDQQATANTRATLDALAAQITAATEAHRQAVNREDAYRPADQSSGLDAHALFMSIPTAIASGDLSRWMTLVFALLVALVLQMTIVATVNATVKQVKHGEVKTVSKPRKRNRSPKKAGSPRPSTEDFQLKDPVAEPSGMTEVL